jgi:hypothetical protein
LATDRKHLSPAVPPSVSPAPLAARRPWRTAARRLRRRDRRLVVAAPDGRIGDHAHRSFGSERPMAKIGRNAPCPCGSGKKYKHCCLPVLHRLGPIPDAPEIRRVTARRPDGSMEVETDLDQLSNSVLRLVRSGRLDEAEQACRRLLAEFPEVTDGHERLASVYEARGDPRSAAQHYRAAIAMIDASLPGDYDPEIRAEYLAAAERLESQAATSSDHPASDPTP